MPESSYSINIRLIENNDNNWIFSIGELNN